MLQKTRCELSMHWLRFKSHFLVIVRKIETDTDGGSKTETVSYYLLKNIVSFNIWPIFVRFFLLEA